MRLERELGAGAMLPVASATLLDPSRHVPGHAVEIRTKPAGTIAIRPGKRALVANEFEDDLLAGVVAV